MSLTMNGETQTETEPCSGVIDHENDSGTDKSSADSASLNGSESSRSSPEEPLRVDTSAKADDSQGVAVVLKRKRSDDSESLRHESHTTAGSESNRVTDNATRGCHTPADRAEDPTSQPPPNHVIQQDNGWESDATGRNTLPTPDTPSTSLTSRPWALSGVVAPIYSHEPADTTQRHPRKRAFSKRGRTGCWTCRKRKKKCGEEKPECANCIKSGHVCLGYDTNRNFLQNLTLTRRPTFKTLQSKDSPVEGSTSQAVVEIRPNSAVEMTFSRSTNDETETVSTRPRQTRPWGLTNPPYGYQRWPQQGHGGQKRDHEYLSRLSSMRRDEDLSNSCSPHPMRPPQSTTAASLPPPRSASGTNSSPVPPSLAPAPPRLQTYLPAPHQPAPTQPYYNPIDYQTGGAVHPSPETAATKHVHRRSYSQMSSHHSTPSTTCSTPAPPLPPLSHASHASTPSAASAPATSSAPLHLSTISTSRTFTAEEIARSKMLRSVPYKHSDPTLVWERKRCAVALVRYNADVLLSSNKDSTEIERSLLKVLDPSQDSLYAGIAPVKERGILSHGVQVEQGFGCSYGYNVKLMDSCYIDRNVWIDDAAKVEIGARCWIGAGVQIITSSPLLDRIARRGPETERVAHPVTIESEAVLGAGCVVYPGVRLGRGCTVMAGMVVKSDVEPGAVFDGKAGSDDKASGSGGW